MKIQINTDNNIAGREELAEQAKATVESTLGHLAEHITRVEVHLIAVSDEAESIGQAIDGAAEKLRRSLDHTLGRLSDR